MNNSLQCINVSGHQRVNYSQSSIYISIYVSIFYKISIYLDTCGGPKRRGELPAAGLDGEHQRVHRHLQQFPLQPRRPTTGIFNSNCISIHPINNKKKLYAIVVYFFVADLVRNLNLL